jgi:nitrogen regulatory protein P-II 1
MISISCRGATKMKKIEAIRTPSTLDAARDALRTIGTQGITVTDVAGFEATGCVSANKKSARPADLVQYVKVEVVVPDALVRLVIDALEDSAGTGQADDGSVRVLDVEEAVRIRTGERGPSVV